MAFNLNPLLRNIVLRNIEQWLFPDLNRGHHAFSFQWIFELSVVFYFIFLHLSWLMLFAGVSHHPQLRVRLEGSLVHKILLNYLKLRLVSVLFGILLQWISVSMTRGVLGNELRSFLFEVFIVDDYARHGLDEVLDVQYFSTVHVWSFQGLHLSCNSNVSFLPLSMMTLSFFIRSLSRLCRNGRVIN